MHFRYRQDQKSLRKKYNRQRRVEMFFPKLKRRLGSSIKSRIGTMRRRAVWMKILSILTVASE